MSCEEHPVDNSFDILKYWKILTILVMFFFKITPKKQKGAFCRILESSNPRWPEFGGKRISPLRIMLSQRRWVAGNTSTSSETRNGWEIDCHPAHTLREQNCHLAHTLTGQNATLLTLSQGKIAALLKLSDGKIATLLTLSESNCTPSGVWLVLFFYRVLKWI